MMSYFILLSCHWLLSIDFIRYVFIVMDTIRAFMMASIYKID